jgi:hypothetical protein
MVERADHRTYGRLSQDVEAFFSEARGIRSDLLIVDDRCLCVPSFELPTSIGATLTLYSTGYSKYVDLGGGGFGFLVAGTPYQELDLPYSHEALREIEAAAKEAIDQGTRFAQGDSNWLETGRPTVPWAEYREQILAGVARAATHKALLNEIYRSGIPEEVCLGLSCDWRFHIRVDDKRQLLERIFERGLFASSHYASLAGVFGPGEALVSQEAQAHIVNLFNDRYYTEEQAQQTVALVRGRWRDPERGHGLERD